MNERLKELYTQVCTEQKLPFTVEHNSAVMLDAFANKFAELIILECMRQVEEQYKPVLEDKEMMKDTHWDGYVQCGVDSVVAIREHFFGVEE